MTTTHRDGRHRPQIPGETPADRILRVTDRSTIDRRGPTFARFATAILKGIRPLFKTLGAIVFRPASGTARQRPAARAAAA